MGVLTKVKSKVKSVAKPSTLAKVALASTGVGALAMGATALQAKKVEKTKYNINSWGPLESDPAKVSLKYSPALSLAKSDKLTVSGTPFDGVYSDPEYRTRNEVYIKPATAVTTSGTGGSFKVKTSMAARAKGGASATKAGVRTAAKKAGSAIKSKVGGIFTYIKWVMMLAPIVGIVGFVIYIKFFSPAALAARAAA
jgi:hypothetical protein